MQRYLRSLVALLGMILVVPTMVLAMVLCVEFIPLVHHELYAPLIPPIFCTLISLFVVLTPIHIGQQLWEALSNAGVSRVATRKHRQSIELPAPPEQVFSILITPSAICKWWQASRAIVLAKPDGFWAATWGAEDDPDYISAAKIKVFDPPRRLVLSDYQYFAKSGPLPFKANFTTEFIIEPKNGGSLLTVIQDGFPEDSIADGFYAGCDVGWKNTLAGIKAFLSH